MKERERQIQNELHTCRHFNGIQHRSCKVGVKYDDVRDPKGGPDTSFPCLRLVTISDRGKPRAPDASPSACEKREYPSREEAEREYDDRQRHIEAFLREANEGKTCPHCHKPIEKKERVGRCLYLRPCGHRLGQVAGDGEP